ncbi:hypothetical protein NDU88_004716 [Pleurodeles waltl]|uniref:Uncharacterized protein n=1 Tax=Pleurodeles waltl TaxID=8319 RepID=A0AAV7RJZ5_PLEWA|nr:hypothetical protein NDU88_004716 [Pleurodeles waltl]
MRALRRSGRGRERAHIAYPTIVAGPGRPRGWLAHAHSILSGAGLPPGPGRSPLGPRLKRRQRRRLGPSRAGA